MPVQTPAGEHDSPEGYEDLERIDQGGYATVYRARDTRFDRTVALKVLCSDTLNERQLRRFRAECLATGRVSSHPNIVTVYDAGTTRGHRPWLAMEYCSGGSLAHKVARQGTLPVVEVISIGAHLCSALGAAHEAGILHRDVKPHNVLITSYGEPALADFGIASVVIDDDTITETAAYTVVHAAPEILEGRAGTASADIYSLGSTLFTLLAGHAPYAKEASTGLAPLVTRIMQGDLPPIARRGVPPELELLLRRSMAADPQDRPGAGELGAALTEMGQRFAAGEIDKQAQQVTHRRPVAPCEPPPAPAAPAPAAPATPAPAPAAPAAPAALAAPATPAPAPATPAPAPPAPATVSGTLSSSLLLILVGTLAVLLAVFTAWGLAHRVSGAVETAPNAAVAKYAPRGLAVTEGPVTGELVVSWTMPIRPDVVATVIYEGNGSKARSIVNYETSPTAGPQATVRGLPSGQQVCFSAGNLVSIGDRITRALSRPVCAVPR